MDNPTERRERRYNWLRLYTVLPRNPKVARLTDAQFRAYVYALCAARDEQMQGEWLDRTYVEAALGSRYGRHVPALIEGALLTEDADGSVRVRQWDYWNPPDATAAKRSADYRARQRAERAGTSLASQPVTRDATQEDMRGDDIRGEVGEEAVTEAAYWATRLPPDECTRCEQPIVQPSDRDGGHQITTLEGDVLTRYRHRSCAS